MVVPTAFTHDEQTAKLAGYFAEIYEYLLAQGVPSERLPSPWHVLSHVVTCLDEERMTQWLEAYVGLEGISPVLEEETRTTQVPAKAPRPAYLRALAQESTKPEEPKS